VHLRRLGDKDVPLVEEHLLGLDMPSRNSRFHCGFGDAAVAAYVRDLDPNRDVLFGAIDPGTGRIVGLAEARPANGPKTVDLATSVLPSHRKRGLAHALVTRAAGVASDQGATAADLRFAPGNLAANRIAARLGASFRAPGIAVVRLPLCEPLAEGVARQMGERGSSSGMTAKGPDAAATCVPLGGPIFTSTKPISSNICCQAAHGRPPAIQLLWQTIDVSRTPDSQLSGRRCAVRGAPPGSC
jgi:GNAT superfamily N-acetyltransferase